MARPRRREVGPWAAGGREQRGEGDDGEDPEAAHGRGTLRPPAESPQSPDSRRSATESGGSPSRVPEQRVDRPRSGLLPDTVASRRDRRRPHRDPGGPPRPRHPVELPLDASSDQYRCSVAAPSRRPRVWGPDRSPARFVQPHAEGTPPASNHGAPGVALLLPSTAPTLPPVTEVSPTLPRRPCVAHARARPGDLGAVGADDGQGVAVGFGGPAGEVDVVVVVVAE